MKKIIFIISFLFTFFNYFVAMEYTVVKGDCLWNIAKKFYENPFLWGKIYEANKDKIKNPDLIYPGQVFLLPDVENIKKSQEQQFQPEEVEEETELSEENKLETQKEQTTEYFQEQQETEQLDQPTEETKEVKEEVSTMPQLKYEENLEFPKKYNSKEFIPFGKIVSAKERKFFYIDFDIVYCEINKKYEIKVGDILGIYHLGPSKYDTTLFNVPKNQLTLIGKLQVLEIDEDKVVCKIIRAYSPILIGDMISGFKK